MSGKDVADALRALATDDTKRSEMARLRDVYVEIELALAAGVTRAQVLETLRLRGFTMKAKTFESALYRLRKSASRKGVDADRAEQTVAAELTDRKTSAGRCVPPSLQELVRIMQPDPVQLANDLAEKERLFKQHEKALKRKTT